MDITLLAFGIAKDIFGASSVTVAVNEASPVSILKEKIELNYPKFKALKSYMVAVNNEYAADDLILSASDEVAIIPPVSGG
ncbi:MoaD/ThiS family protein [Mucilaginibacter pallidiroseus]|uniref:Molybdopterin synthase sulfur carrier subunit n=1 Tax=Mucilaginibacter pallidiroseus TaxID=2599295 RepID=A0A563UJ78_9SPHI|nr:MoaD/ThiS family protein [Mucilaginibacter pallidiroseus]TWR31440.1 MoaD/ThiS family protein [Mucilaginibacter pallidiroseus]